MNWKQGVEFVLFVGGFAFLLWLCGNEGLWLLGLTCVYAVYVALHFILDEIKKLRDYIDINPNKNEENK